MKRAKPADLVVDALATYRLTQIINTDGFGPLAEQRARFFASFPVKGRAVDRSVVVPTGEADGSHVHLPSMVPVAKDASGAYVALESSFLGELAASPWVVGLAVALGVGVARRLVPFVWRTLGPALAASATVDLLGLAEQAQARD